MSIIILNKMHKYLLEFLINIYLFANKLHLNTILFNTHFIFNNLLFHKRMSDWAAIRQ